jgi:hypothetical protein
MRRLPHLLAAAAIAGAVVSQGALAQTNTSSRPAPISQHPSDRNLPSAVETPLRNANLVNEKIPPVLVAAVQNPYARSGRLSCAAITAQVAELTAALGPDFDAGGSGDKSHLAPAAVRVAANTFIPFQGVLRFVSGAEAHDRKVIRAIIAGSARRSYLKGLGEARGCTAPASPVGAVPPSAPTHVRRRSRRSRPR